VLPRKPLIVCLVLLLSSFDTTAQKPELVLPVGHTESIYLAEYINEGKMVLTISYDNTAKLWDTYTGKLLHSFDGLMNSPEHVVNIGNTTLISKDRKYLIALTRDGFLKKWELPSCKQIFSVRFNTDQFKGLSFSDDGTSIIKVSDGQLKPSHFEMKIDLIDAANGKTIQALVNEFPHYRHNKDFEFSPDGRSILFKVDSSLYLYIAPGKTLKFKLERLANFRSAFFTPDSKQVLVFPKNSNLLQVWSVADGTLQELRISGTVVFSPDGKHILSNVKGELYLLDAVTGNIVHHLGQVTSSYMSAYFSEDGRNIFLVKEKGFIRGMEPADSITHIWETASGKLVSTIQQNGCDINNVVKSDDGQFYATVCGVTTTIWEASTNKQITSVEGTTNGFSPGSRDLAITSGRTVRIFNLRSREVIAELKGHSNPLVNANFSVDGKQLVTLSNDTLIKFWDIPKGILTKVIKEPAVIIDAGFSKDGKSILLVTEDGKAFVRSIATGEKQFDLSGNKIKAAYYSPDGKLIVTAADSVFTTWDAQTGMKLFQVGESYHITDAGISPGGNFGYYIFGESAVAVVELATGQAFKEYLGGENIIRCRFSPTGTHFFLLGEKGTAKLLETKTGKLVKQLGEFSDVEYGISHMGGYYYENIWKGDYEHFSSDGKYLQFRKYRDPYLLIKDLNTDQAPDTIRTPRTLVKSAVFFAQNTKLVTGTTNDTIRIWSRENKKYKLLRSFPGNGFKISPDEKWLVIIDKVQLQFYDLLNDRFRAQALAVNESDYFIQLADRSYYAASKNALQTLLFRLGDQFLSFEQFDIRWNRPDLVLQAMQYSEQGLIQAYKKAYEKRVKRSGIDKNSFRNDLNIPHADFLDKQAISFEQDKETLSVRISATDKLYKLDRLNIWVNDVPLYGSRGMDLQNRNARSYDTTITIRLSAGRNQLKTSVTNRNGVESYRSPLVVNYKPVTSPVEKVYFIGIGIDRFADTSKNLQYSRKDIRDLSFKFKEKYGESLFVDTLFNERVTVSNVKALKQKLQQTSVNDKVIVSYSGHGVLDKEYDYFLSTYNINFDRPGEKGLHYDELENLLDGIPARRKLLLIDACHSGELDKEEMAQLSASSDTLAILGVKGGKPRRTGTTSVGMKNSFELMQSLFVNVGKSTGATIISAAAGTQFALERGDLKNGVFTYSILEAIDKDPNIRISDLKKIVGERVERLTNGLQKPTSRNETITSDWNL
jgi:WD40 repeat protein